MQLATNLQDSISLKDYADPSCETNNISFHVETIYIFCFSSVLLTLRMHSTLLASIVRSLTDRLYISDISVSSDNFYVVVRYDPNRHAYFAILLEANRFAVVYKFIVITANIVLTNHD